MLEGVQAGRTEEETGQESAELRTEETGEEVEDAVQQVQGQAEEGVLRNRRMEEAREEEQAQETEQEEAVTQEQFNSALEIIEPLASQRENSITPEQAEQIFEALGEGASSVIDVSTLRDKSAVELYNELSDIRDEQATAPTQPTTQKTETVQEQPEVAEQEGETTEAVDEGDRAVAEELVEENIRSTFEVGADKALDWIAKKKAEVKARSGGTLASGITPDAVYLSMLTAAEVAIKAGKGINEVVAAAKKAVKDSEWYKSLNDNDKIKAIDEVDENFGKPRKRTIPQETAGLSLREQFTQGFKEYTEALKEKTKEAREKAQKAAKEKLEATKARMQEQIDRAKDDKEATKTFIDFGKEVIKELNLSPTQKSELNALLSGVKNVTSKNFDKVWDKFTQKTEEFANKRVDKEIEEKSKKINKKIRSGKFGNFAEQAISLMSIPSNLIPQKLRTGYNNLLTNLSKPGEIDAKDFNALSEFLIKYASEIQQEAYKAGTKEETDSMYATFMEDSEAEDKEKLIEAMKLYGFSEAAISYVENNFNDIKNEVDRREKSKGSNESEVNRVKEERRKLLEKIKNTDRTVNTKLFKDNEIASKAAAVFAGIKPKDLRDLSLSSLRMLPQVYSNLRLGLVTPAAYEIASEVKGARLAESTIEDSEVFKRFVSNGVEAFRSLSNALKTEIGQLPTEIKNVDKLVDRFVKQNITNLDGLVNGIKGTAIYDILNKYTSGQDTVNTKYNHFRDRLNEAFYEMRGLPLFNNTLLSVYVKAREFDMNPDNPEIHNPKEYIKETLNAEGNRDRKVVLRQIQEMFFDENGNPPDR